MRPNLLLADADSRTTTWLTHSLNDQAAVTVVTRMADTLTALCTGTYDALIVGRKLDDCHGTELIQALTGVNHSVHRVPPILTIDHDGDSSSVDAHVYYALKAMMPPEEVRAVVLSAVQKTAICPSRPKISLNSQRQASQMQRVLHMTRRLLSLHDLKAAEAACLLSIRELTDCEHAYCFFHDAGTGSLWSEGDTAPSRATEHRATHGLTGFCARTGTSMCLMHASMHPGYAAHIDDPMGLGDEHVLIQPVIGSDGCVHAVFVAVRRASQAPFSTLEQEVLSIFADRASPLLEQLGLQLEAEALLNPAPDTVIFREEALDAYAVRRHHGDVIRVSPRWSDWAYWVIVAFVVISVGFAAIAKIARYSTGPAVVRVANRSAVTAHLRATVVAVDVVSGQWVQAGQRLARFDDAEQEATIERLDQALATQVRHDMLEPANQSVQQVLHALQIDLNGTRAALASRTLRAQHAGMVRDIRIWPGKRIEPGEVLMSVINDESDFYIEAFLPGDITPKLAPGMPLRLEMNGDRYANQTLIIDAVSTGIMGSTEARRYLGPQMADVVSITGPVVVVRARLTQRHFAADGHQYLYHDGMQATAAVQLSSQPLYRALVPGLERW